MVELPAEPSTDPMPAAETADVEGISCADMAGAEVVDESLTLLPAEDNRPLGSCLAALNNTGWSLTPAIDWLFGPGCRTDSFAALLDGVAEALLSAGAPVQRLRFGIWAIHPQRAARSYTWRADTRRTEHTMIGHDIFSTPDFIGSPAQVVREAGRPIRYRLDRLDPAKHHSVLFSVREAGATDYLGLPMQSFSGRQDSLFVATDQPDGFSASDVAKFRLLARLLMPVIEALNEHQLAVGILETYLGPRAGRRVLRGQIRRGDGEHIEAALWYSDLRSFTAMTETVEEGAMLDLMNRYFEHIYNSVSAYGGEVLRFIGDAMLVVFPTEDGRSVARACDDALAAARDAMDRLPSLNAMQRRRGLPPIRFGIGLHEGTVVYGNVGAPDRLDFTVMGPAVNRTSRIESLTKTLDTPVLMSAAFAARLPADTPYEALGVHAVPGVPNGLSVARPLDLD